jgi:chromosome segregation ATPase
MKSNAAPKFRGCVLNCSFYGIIVEKGVSRMEELLKKMMEQMNQQFEKIDKRFEAMDKRFDQMDERFDQMDKRLDQVEQRLDRVEQRLNGVEQRLDKLETTVESLKETVENNATEFRSHFRQIEKKLDEHEAIFKTVADEIKWVKFDIDHLSKKDGIHEKEINQIKMRMQI